MAVAAVARKTSKAGAAAEPTPSEVLQQAVNTRSGIKDALTAYLTDRNPTQRPSARIIGDVQRLTAGQSGDAIIGGVYDALCTVAEIAARSEERALAAEAIRFAKPKLSLPTAMTVVAQTRANKNVAFANILARFG